jgi:hypothetical protein
LSLNWRPNQHEHNCALRPPPRQGLAARSLFVGSNPFFHSRRIQRRCSRRTTRSLGPYAYAEAGGLMSYSSNVSMRGVKPASSILEGAKPADLSASSSWSSICRPPGSGVAARPRRAAIERRQGHTLGELDLGAGGEDAV